MVPSRINLMPAYDPAATTPVLRTKQVVVVGGGNAAMDAVQTVKEGVQL